MTIRKCIEKMREVSTNTIVLINKTKIYIHEINADKNDYFGTIKWNPDGSVRVIRRIFCTIDETSRTKMLDELKSNKDWWMYGTALKQVRIPGSVKTLPSATFAGCSLDLLVLEEGVERIGKEAFDYTKKIKTIVLPSTMKSVNFSYNNKIETIYYKGTVEQRAQIVYGGVADGIKLAKNWYFYSETTPTDTENQYWHYDNEGNIVLY